MKKYIVAITLFTTISCRPVIEKSSTVTQSPTNPSSVAESMNLYPKPTSGGPWAEFCLKHSPMPNCVDNTVAVCVKKQYDNVVLGYVWECVPDSWYE